MFKVIATDAVISKGYDGAPALKYSESGESVRFRIGKKVYDTRAKNNHRWVNLSVKAFGAVCDRIKKMQVKEGSFINILGRLDEDVWEDQTTHEKKSAIVVILDEIEYCASGANRQQKESTEDAASAPQANNANGGFTGNSFPGGTQPQQGFAGVPQNTQPAQAAGNAGGNFTGYEPFGGVNSFFDE